jgi:hypothetical protein
VASLKASRLDRGANVTREEVWVYKRVARAPEIVGLAGVVHLPLRGSWRGVFVSCMIEEGKDGDLCCVDGR